jgi:predicted  nucleic acid-binding Zn-ribbon protein
MDLVEVLVRLALVDEEWDDKGRQYQEARDRLGNPRQLIERREQQERLSQSSAVLRSSLANLELELASMQARSTRVEQDLYGGAIGSPRELENLRRESEQLKKHISQLEDQGLALMADSDGLESEVVGGAAELESFERIWEQGTAAARDVYQAMRTRLQELQTERERLRVQVPVRELALYDELRRTKGGRPLAPMSDGVCQVCHVSVPRNKVTIAAGGQDAVATCEGCGRILYQA